MRTLNDAKSAFASAEFDKQGNIAIRNIHACRLSDGYLQTTQHNARRHAYI